VPLRPESVNPDSSVKAVAGPQVWNCLTPEVTLALSLATFRTRLKRRFCLPSYVLTFGLSDIFASIHCLQWTL